MSAAAVGFEQPAHLAGNSAPPGFVYIAITNKERL
jgi:hypothetical protein